jgi:hypothetical protein
VTGSSSESKPIDYSLKAGTYEIKLSTIGGMLPKNKTYIKLK